MKPAFDGQLAAQISKQLQQQFAPLNNTFTGTLSPQDMAAINKMSGFQQPRQERLSEKAREANIEAFNEQLALNAKTMGEVFVQNTKDKPIEEQYRAFQQAQEALKNQYANLSEEQLGIALTAFNEQADVFAKADKEAGFFARTGDALSYIPTTATKLGEQLTGLFSPDGSARQWFSDATKEVESWRSDEAKLRALQSADAMAQAKARGELGFTQFFSNAADNPLETIGQFVESALPTAGSALIGAAAAPITGGVSLALPFVVGGVQGAGSARNEIHDHIMAMPEAQLQQNAQYQTLLAKGLSPEQARTELAGSFAEHGGEVLATGLSSAALSGLGGLGRIGQVGKGVMGSTAGKFASELVTEPTDEVFQQFMANKAIRDVDATHSLTDGLGEAAAGGLLFGAAGGAVAAADNIYRTPSAESVQQQSDGVVENIVAQGNAEQPQPTVQQTAQPQPQQAVENPQNVASQTANSQQNRDDVRYSFAGQNAKTANHSLLEQAERDLASGKDPEAVRQETGWFTGKDGKWRFEIDDSQITFKRDWDKSVNASGVISSTEYSKGYNATATVGDILNAPELFAAYPDLADIKLDLIENTLPDDFSSGGMYASPFGHRKEHILLKGDLHLSEVKSVLLHELQHAIQERENFATGANPNEYTQDILDEIAPYEKRKNKTRMREIEQQDPDFVRNYNEMQVAIGDWLGYDGGDPDTEAQLEKEASIWEGRVRSHPLYDEYREAEYNSANEIYDKMDAYQATAGEVEARNVQTRMNMTVEERLNRSPKSTEDVIRENQIVRYAGGVIANSLNEESNSEFAIAVDEVVNGNVSRGYITMGTTPDVLKMLGLPDTKIRIQGKTIEKVMGEYLGIEQGKHSHLHNLTPETLKRLPQNINNPVAVFNSSTRGNGYVVLTELTETDNRTGKNKPVIAALHLKAAKGGVEIIDIASVYGRSQGQLQTAFDEELLYLNKEKAQRLNTERLQLSWDFTSDAELFTRNVKTETDLSQYQSGKNTATPSQIQQDQATLSRILGEATASHIQVVDRNTPIPTGQNVKKLAAKGVEGWFDVSAQKLYIISDNITANEVLSRDERLAWVAFHELSHAGVRIKYGPILTNVLASAGKNVVVKVLARKIQAEYGYTQEVATEEAMAEIYAAFETGNWAELESRYKVKIHQSYKQGKDSVGDFLTKVANILRRLIGGIVGKDLTQTMTTSQVFETLRGIQQGVNDIANTEQDQTASGEGNRYSLNESKDSEFARAVEAIENGDNPASAKITLGTTPDVLRMLGIDDGNVIITARTLRKDMVGKHKVSPEAMKQLPQQLNDPIAVVHSRPDSTNPEAYLMLTELTEVENGKELPVIAALDFVKNKDGDFELVEIASAYGRKNVKVAKDLLYKPYYWNKAKGNHFLKNFSLSPENSELLSELRTSFLSDDYLSAHNIKTEADLSQYQAGNSTRYSRKPQDLSQSATDNNGEFSAENEDIRYSIKQSVADLAKTGKAKADPTFIDELKTKDYNGFKKRFDKAVGKLDEWIADGLRPVNDWIDNTLKGSGISAHEAERLKDDMYRAKGVRDALNSELEQAYLKPLLKKVAEVAKKHKLDELSAKRLIGYWASTRYAIEKNNEILAREHQAMLNAEKALNDAKAKGEDIEALSTEYRKAERQYRDRKHDVELALNSDEEFKVGTAGGWSNAEAQHIMANIEKHIPRKELELAVSYLYALNQRRLEIDHKAGRYTEEQYKEFRKNRHYVPLTGDPNADENFDGISGAAQNAVNVSKDRALKGRKLSEAEDGIDASWRGINNSTTYAGWVDFKNSIDDIFESTVSELVEKGHSERSAREQAEKTLGISKQRMQGTTRSSDDVLIRKVGGIYYEYKLPQEVITALKNDNVENANAFLKVLSTPTSWYARGVTQWTITFAPMNMLRDTWEKSEFIRVQKLYDKEGNLLDDKTMDKIGRAVLKNAFYNKGTWKATKRMGFNQELRNEGDEKLLKRLLELGGVSTYSTYLARTETDLVKKVKSENSALGKRLEQAGSVLESYNKVFDTVSALAAFKAMLDHGVDEKQAAAKTLELTNFRKTGSKMRGIKALYMFSQPTAMGARNLIKYLATPKGRHRFFGYMAVMMPLYLALRAMDDEDEGGNVMDQLGDITRYIPLPIGDGKYLKIPVGFGMPQMAWNFSVNMAKAGVGDISFTEAGINMLVHSMKTFAPVSPSEISAAKYPLEKLTLTATPTILQPLMQNVLNRSAFGSKITTNFVSEGKLKSEQSKSTTAQFWKDLAIGVNDTLGIDMHPEQIKNLFDGYGAMLGSLRELQTIFIENPNREQLGRRTRTPFLNQFIGTTNEFSIQSRYYEASEEARTFYKRYESRKERGIVDELSPQERAMLNWHNLNEKRMQELRSEKAKHTKALREKKINANIYEARIKAYNEKMDKTQRVFLKRWREMQELNTH